MKSLLSLAFMLAGSSAFADQQAIPPGTTPTADQLGHVFAEACFASQPGLIERRAEILETAFSFIKSTTTDLDAEWIAPDGALRLSVDGNPINTECTMHIPGEIGGDGAALYEGLEAHLPEGAQAVTAEAVEGGLTWSWAGNDVSYRIDYIESDGDFSLLYKAER